MIKSFFTKQFLKFLISGGTAALLHWLSRMLLSQWMPFTWAVLLAYGVGMATAFTLNFLFVFPNSKRSMAQQTRGFFWVNLGFLPVVWAASIQIRALLNKVHVIPYPDAVAHGLAIMLPTMATFLIYKFFTFKELEYGQQ